MRTILSLLLFSILLLLGACSFNKNDDNVIYVPGRKFHFNITYIDKDGTIRKVDPLELEVTKGFYPQRKQTAIDWVHFQTHWKDTTLLKETTGVVDAEDEFFIHPPREGDLYVLSFAEFPTIHTSVFTDTTSKIKSTGTVTMAKSYKGKTITQVNTTQEYQGKANISLPINKTVRAHHLRATAKSELGTIYGNYYFSEDWGFVRMDYLLPDSTKISIQLTGTEF